MTKRTLGQSATEAEIESCIIRDLLTIGCAKRIPFIKSACIKPTKGSEDSMPVLTGRVKAKSVSVLRDTGCSGVVIKRDLVTEDELTGRFGFMLLIDKTIRKIPIAKVFIEKSYFTGEVEAQYLPDAIYEVISGNIPNARGPENPDLSWETACAITRAQAKKGEGLSPLKVPDANAVEALTGDAGNESEEEMFHEENLLELGSLSSKESYKDVKVSPKLFTTQLDDLESLIQEFKPLFTDKLGSTSLIEHSINLTTDVPIRSKPYDILIHTRTWEEHIEASRKLLSCMLKWGITARPSKCVF